MAEFGIDPVTQVRMQNALIADALFDVAKIISAYPTSQPGGPFADLAADLRTQVNALNPDKYRFP